LLAALAFLPPAYLTFVEDFLGDFIFKNFRRLRLAEHLVLTQRQKAFEYKLRQGEANDELLPRE
jgi:hypothetical protein